MNQTSADFLFSYHLTSLLYQHCQFVEGSEPDGYPFDGSSSSVLASATDAASQQDRGGDGTGLGTVGVILIIALAMAVMGAAFALFLRRRQHTTTHLRESTKSSDGNLPDADGDNLGLPMPTRTFESVGNSHDEDEDIAEITAVDSGHLA